MPFATLANLLRLLGPLGIARLVVRKLARARRYKKTLYDVPRSKTVAQLKAEEPTRMVPLSHRDEILPLADALIRDENYFFTFPYRTRGIDRIWEYDPIERKHWPRRHYTERILHAPDTPQDAKIVFEINRFKELPALGQATLLMQEQKYAKEAERRIVSWIENNSFANSVNWSSGLEIAIRLISWSATLILLKRAGFDISVNPIIARSVYEQVRYLAADMGTDKVIPINHLIGEVSGVFIVSALFEFPEAKTFRKWSQTILEKEIIQQTFSDGVTREASSWYHQFVMHFFDLADRIADKQYFPFSEVYKSRLSQMHSFAESMTMNMQLVRYGDSDDGWAFWLPGNLEEWKDFIFGPSLLQIDVEHYFPQAEVEASHIGNSFLFLRAGKFGMGGAGFSSHAHDDFLSPILFLDSEPVLADPGTFIYNGDEANRALYRRASSHNGLVLADESGLFSTGAVSKSNFGWKSVRPNAKILKTEFDTTTIYVKGQYAEWPQHAREITVMHSSATITDSFSEINTQACEWHFHLDPQWKSGKHETNIFEFQNNAGKKLRIELRGDFEDVACESYDYSPSYRVAVPATVLRMTSPRPRGTFEMELTLSQ